MSYVGVPPFGQTVRTVTERIAQQDQTIFYPDGGYLPGYIDVELDGSDLGSQDFTATDGLSVVLAQKAGAGSLFRTKAYWPVSLIDTMRRGEINGIVGAGGWAMRNRIINGDMRIDQRNAGASVNSNSATNPYLTDRWRSFASTGSGQFSAQQSTTAPSGFSNSLLFTALASTSVGASDMFCFRQPIEGLNCADLGFGTASAQTVTLSFWIRSSLTGTFGGAIANNSANRSYPFSYTISAANTWEYKTITVTGDTTGTWATDNTTGINVWFGLGVGSAKSGTAGAWAGADYRSATGAASVVGTSGATLNITGVQLEKGSYATPFDFRPYGAELALCQRYYEQANYPAFGNCIYGAGSWQSTGNVTIPYKTVKRGSTTTSVTLAGSIDNCASVSLGNDVFDSGLICGFAVTNASYPYMRANILYKASAEL